MKVLLVSDTHRHLNHFVTVLERVSPVDRILHLGDAEGEEDVIRSLAGTIRRGSKGRAGGALWTYPPSGH